MYRKKEARRTRLPFEFAPVLSTSSGCRLGCDRSNLKEVRESLRMVTKERSSVTLKGIGMSVESPPVTINFCTYRQKKKNR